MLHTLSADEGQLIEQLMPFTFDPGVIYKSKRLSAAGIDVPALLALEDLGIISGGQGTLTQSTKGESAPWAARLTSHGFELICHSNEVTEFALPVYALTRVGRELASLGSYEPDEEYLREIGSSIKAKGFRVQLGRVVTADNAEPVWVGVEI